MEGHRYARQKLSRRLKAGQAWLEQDCRVVKGKEMVNWTLNFNYSSP